MSSAMMSASRAPEGMQIGVNETMQVTKGLYRRLEGSCNACATTVSSEQHETVTRVELRGLNFRLCPPCATQLKLAL
jgi:hypothetical protein